MVGEGSGAGRIPAPLIFKGRTMLSFLLGILLQSSACASDFLPKTFSADFEETVVSVRNGKEIRSFGKLDYKFPRHVRYEIVSADRQSTFVANPKTCWQYTPPFVEGEPGEVKVRRSEAIQQLRFIDVLAKGRESNKTYAVSFEKALMVLSFTETGKKEFDLDRLELVARSGDATKALTLADFNELILQRPNAKPVRMKLLRFSPGVELSAEKFVFEIPKNTKVDKEG